MRPERNGECKSKGVVEEGEIDFGNRLSKYLAIHAITYATLINER